MLTARMKLLLWGATVATSISAASWFVLSNSVLALTTSHYCVVLFEVPFTDKSFRLPDWTFGWIPISVCGLSTIASVALWIVALVKRRRQKAILKGKAQLLVDRTEA